MSSYGELWEFANEKRDLAQLDLVTRTRIRLDSDLSKG